MKSFLRLYWRVFAVLVITISGVWLGVMTERGNVTQWSHDVAKTYREQVASHLGKPKPTPKTATVPAHKAPVSENPASQQQVQPHVTPDYVLPPVVDGEVPVVDHIPTERKVVFLTIDDGLTKTPDAPRLLKKYRIKAPMFLNDVYIEDNPDYFKGLVKQGMTVENHTIDHPDLTTLSYDDQVAEICNNADKEQQHFGVRPTLLRPPYGSYNDSVLRAAAACGMKAAVQWSAKANGGSMQYQYGHTGLVPGDIVLMHFRPEFAKDFQAFIDAAKAAGLQPENLEDWLQQPTPSQSPLPGQ